MKKLLATLAALLISLTAHADVLKTDAELRPFTDAVMARVAKGEVSAAFEAMRPYVTTPESEFQSLAMAARVQREQFNTRFGKATGFEFIGERRVGESLLRLTYIEKTEKHALPWQFFYYRTSGGWVLNSILWNDQVQQLFVSER